MRHIIGFFIFGLTSFISAQAQTPCLEIHNESARLACYDSTYGYSTPETNTTNAETLGLAVPAMPAPIAPSPKEVKQKRKKLNAATYPLSKLDETATGKILVYLQDGQVWRQTDSLTVRIRKTRPSEITIKPASLGSFMIKWDGQRAFRAKRIK